MVRECITFQQDEMIRFCYENLKSICTMQLQKEGWYVKMELKETEWESVGQINEDRLKWWVTGNAVVNMNVL